MRCRAVHGAADVPLLPPYSAPASYFSHSASLSSSPSALRSPSSRTFRHYITIIQTVFTGVMDKPRPTISCKKLK